MRERRSGETTMMSNERSAEPAGQADLRERPPGGWWSFHRLDIAIGVRALPWFIYSTARVWSSESPTAGDDAFISFQYARNLARGLGLVFNSGERIWGFTSPLQTILLGLLTSAGFDTVRAAFVTGFLWTSLAAVLLYVVAVDLLPRVLALGLA